MRSICFALSFLALSFAGCGASGSSSNADHGARAVAVAANASPIASVRPAPSATAPNVSLSPAISPAAAAHPSPSASPAHAIAYTYTTTVANTGPCNENVLTIMNGLAPASPAIAYDHGEAPPLTVANCNFTAGHVIGVALDTPKYGSPYVTSYVQNSVAIDADGPAEVLATWTDLGDPLDGPSHGVSGQVYITIR